MHLLITGGAGFIGGNFLRMILKAEPDVRITNVDKLTYAGDSRLPESLKDEPNHRFVHGDIADPELMNRVIGDDVDMIINFAAESHVDRSIEDPGVFIRTNVMGVQTLLDAAIRHKVGKFVQISTDEVYGSLGETGLFSETTPLDPSSPYSASKTAADHLVMAWHRTYGLDINITRCSNNYGPFQFPEKLIPVMIHKALSDQQLPVYGDGSNIRDWIHVNDHCKAIWAVATRGTPGRIYNIGGSQERSNLDVVREILSALEKPEDLISFVPDRLGHDWRYAIDSSRMQNELGWAPTHTFRTGLAQTIKWYLANPQWWTPLLKT